MQEKFCHIYHVKRHRTNCLAEMWIYSNVFLMQKMPPFKRDTNDPKPRNEEMQPSIDATESDVSLFGTDAYEKGVSEYLP